jgi:hypothetical protein
MADVISLDATRLRSRQVVDLDGVTVTIDLQWLPRLRGWYADVYAADGSLLCTGRRLEPGASSVLPDLTLPGAPPGLLIVTGTPNVYRPDGLGRLVLLEYVTAAELAED